SADMRLPRKDGKSGGITFSDTQYDQVATIAMLEAFRAQPLFKRILFNDPDLIKKRLCQKAPGHDNHFHFEIKPPPPI
ncbi:MAG TPA: hypothetical protein VIJ25_02955, partial [Methylococcales bacterium]